MSGPDSVSVAVCQYEPRVGELERNRELGSTWIERAADAGARLVVLPELASSGYTFQSSEEAAACAEATAGGPLLSAWIERCRRHSVYVVAGFAERAADRLYNSALLLGPEGVLGVYRKTHLFFDEKTYFQPGNLGLPVFQLPFGRVGILICYDIWFPEAARALALQGADLICVPTNWVANFRRAAVDERGWTMGDYACVGLATQNQVFVAAADRVGQERSVQFVGCSCIVGPDGWMIAGPASPDADELLLAEVDLARVERSRQRTPRNHTFGDRRPELYRELLAPFPAEAE